MLRVRLVKGQRLRAGRDQAGASASGRRLRAGQPLLPSHAPLPGNARADRGSAANGLTAAAPVPTLTEGRALLIRLAVRAHLLAIGTMLSWGVLPSAAGAAV
jgi:hypothetical protein